MKMRSIRVFQALFGLFYLANGLNFFYPFFAIPRPQNPIAGLLMQGFVTSGMFTYVKSIEVLTGISMLSGLAVPLMLVLSFPVTVMIAYIDVIVLGMELHSWVWGGGLFVAHSLLMIAYFPYYRPLFVWRASAAGSVNVKASADPVALQHSRR